VNLPNLLSLLRIFLVAPFLIAVIYRYYGLALALFVVAGLSDYLDGYLARRLQQKSVLGTYLDPLGDKLLASVVAKDVYVALGSAVLFYSGNLRVVIPSFWGKFATMLQIVAIGLVLLASQVAFSRLLLAVLFISTAAITTIACVHYIWHGTRIFKESSE
jgi:cardiolipin synthase